MAEITQLNLLITEDGGRSRIQVDYSITFQDNEIGKTFYLSIDIKAHDGKRDADAQSSTVNSILIGDRTLLKMKLTNVFLDQYRLKINARESVLNGNAVDYIDTEKLNEDSGSRLVTSTNRVPVVVRTPDGRVIIEWRDSPYTLEVFYNDEIYAEALLSLSKQSPFIVQNFGA